ncbi:pentatricopeptide repeat-containing protein At2g03880, mitochondrial-like [Typha latifolia]|uniref:pentatricopeptide repeat-containing protein At2g03880, mitochondrial-like n=1 Tax=Typha latifolia TaxID=4733 RepID=UPI003C2EECA6
MSCRATQLSSILRTCAASSLLRQGNQAHAQAITHGLLPHPTLETDIVLFYARCSLLHLAHQVFDQMPHRTMHSYNILFSSYAQTHLFGSSLSLIQPFLASSLLPDRFTFPSLLKSCAGIGDVSLGMAFHCWVIHLGFDRYVIVQSSVLDMYAKCGLVNEAIKVFESTPEKDSVVWNSMISGLARSGRAVEALGVFRRLQWEGVETDLRAIPSILNVCGREGDLVSGKAVHGKVIRWLMDNSDLAVGNSLIDMYSKCGNLGYSKKVFLSMHEQNVVTWSTLIACYGVHGKGKESLIVYEEMLSQGVKPNCVTFTSILSSCSHSGLLDEGRRVFESMSRAHGVNPTVEHYACMVDLLGRAGNIEDALELISRMPMEPSASVWGALLSACAVHRNVNVGEISAQRLFELESGNSSNYVALCGIYDAVGQLDSVAELRSRMRNLGMVKTPGCSWIAVKGRVHAFYQGDIYHPLTRRMLEVFDGLIQEMATSEGR